MSQFDHRKYTKTPAIHLSDRTWPDNEIIKAPQWCSVDLRDGNQALVNPMTIEQKHRMFDLLIKMGFKQIEVGFPAASQTDFDFVREIIEQGKIPPDVSIQVLTPARDEVIERTFKALKGAPKAIIHLYNSTSTIQREQVFCKDMEGIKAIAISGAKKIKQQAAMFPETQFQFQYSPESFSQTEPDFAVDICNAVIDAWGNSDQPIIIDLPATVEVHSPNVYADQIEYMCRNIKDRNKVIISLHTHNDRGCGVAAAELGIMAGADRIEGTVLGNGERTGNMDIITMAMNLYSQGFDPELDMSNMDEIIETVECCTDIKLHPRHPYAGELVFTAFSGSHQDAIKKCLAQQQDKEHWQVAYLPIDPKDLGRSYDAVIRINSQSGKGGVAYIIEEDCNVRMPRWMKIEFSQLIQKLTEENSQEVGRDEIIALFSREYLEDSERILLSYKISRENNIQNVTAEIIQSGVKKSISASAGGLLETFCKVISDQDKNDVHIIKYEEITGDEGSDAEAQAFVQLSVNGQRFCGYGISMDIAEAGMKAVLNAYNRSQVKAEVELLKELLKAS
ncbi:MAG: 2-isopropylmalate synthase [Pseudomonadales bacterium]|nr:2-isopropylmalate synthase [Pseudomonadales bacterium]